ncbi:hypothetical protein BpHYR1_047879 [Brachionus plicatilis]|uniref:Uncharacterized protein n=1 Tax=Brachionus plicatilis TaxID=10195 RepID=A0A3M7T8N0_BRAPC|nr:hypothetical protein BpHYR1_047879 [Brachionus plicatilis]
MSKCLRALRRSTNFRLAWMSSTVKSAISKWVRTEARLSRPSRHPISSFWSAEHCGSTKSIFFAKYNCPVQQFEMSNFSTADSTLIS